MTTLSLLGTIGCRPPAIEPVTVSPYPSLVGQTAPGLTGALTWFNGAAERVEALTGRVVVLQFFDYSCVNCIRTYPYLLEWNRRYAGLGLQIIGVHSPQYNFSTDPANVLASVRQYQLPYPIAVDSHWTIATAFANRFWPRLLIVDRAGQIRFDHTGEGAYADAEQMIQMLLRETNPDVRLPALFPPVHDFDKPGAVCYPITPELYLGHLRGQLANAPAAAQFELPAQREEGRIYANGDWTIHDEYVRHAKDKEDLEDCLVVKYRAVELNIVMKPESIYWMQVFVEQDGRPIPPGLAGHDVQHDATGRSFVRVDVPRMYNIIARQPYGTYEARISVRGQGLSVYSFSFGTCAMPKDADILRSVKDTL